MQVFKLPDLGEGLPDAEIREWHIKAGDTVEVDQPLVAMETAKAVVEVPSPWAGEIGELHGGAGDVIDTGAPLITFANVTSKQAGKQDTGTVVGNIERSDTVVAETGQVMKKAARTTGGIKATPAVKQLAKQLNVDLSQITATGPNNTITAKDVKQAGSAPKAVAAAPTHDLGEMTPIKGTRRTMAQAMTHSHQNVVPVTIFDEVDIHAWGSEEDITVRVVRAIVAACKAEPSLNAWYDNAQRARRLMDAVHLGLAIDTEEGLLVPVIENVDQLVADKPSEVRTAVNTYKQQARDRSIPTENLSGATLTLTNVGMFAGRFATPIIVPPQVSIVCCGRITEKPVAVDGQVAVHKVMPLSLTFDHCAVTGGEASRFLAALIKDLQQ